LQDRQLKKTRNGVWFVIKSGGRSSLKKDHVDKANDVDREPNE